MTHPQRASRILVNLYYVIGRAALPPGQPLARLGVQRAHPAHVRVSRWLDIVVMATPLLGHVDGKRARHNPFVTAVYVAATSAELEQALRTLGQHLGASPGARKRLGKGYVIDVGVSKRAANRALWTREVAVAFAGVLTSECAPSRIAAR